MKTIIFHGYLKDLQPEPLKVHAESVIEALSALQLVPAFSPRLGKKHHVRVEGFNSRDALYDRCKDREIHVHPVMVGAGGGGLGQIIVGAILVVVGVVTANPMLIQAGLMIALGGVLQMLAPQPKQSSAEDRSKYLGVGKNTVEIGTRIPMVYGRHKAFGQYLSFAIQSDDLNSAPSSWYSSTFTDEGELTFSAAPPELPPPPPGIYDGQPSSFFTGLSYESTMIDQPNVFVHFSPAVTLAAGQWDINFVTGQALHVNNLTEGLTSVVTVLGGAVDTLPPNGTKLVFTRNYG